MAERAANLPLTPTFIDGLLLLVNAVPDLQLVIDCANCGSDKFAAVALNHDLHSSLIQPADRQRACFSDLRANEFVLGTEDRLAATIRRTLEELSPKMVLLLASSAVQLLGSDLPRVAEELEEERGVPIAVVPPRTFDGDLTDGYAAGLEQVVRRLVLPPSSPEPNQVALVGFRFDRGEEDTLGNLRELERLLGALGLTLSTACPGGEPLERLGRGLARAERVLSLPSGRRAAQLLAGRLGVPLEELSLPVGLSATAAWVESLGERIGRPEAAKRLVERELEGAVPKLEWVLRQTFLGRRAAVIFDPVMAPPFVHALEELGFEVPLLALQSRRPEARADLLGALSLAGRPEVILDPTFPVLEDRLRALFDRGSLDVIVGSGRARDAAKELPVPYLEVGFPSYLRHALFDAPWVGFRGALWLADALMNMIRESEYRRYPS